MSHPLDNPVWNALNGPHRRFATRHGLAAHYARDVAAFSAIAEDSAQAYTDLAHDLPAGAEARLVRHEVGAVPHGWAQVKHLPLYQMIATEPDGQLIDGPAITTLGPADIAAVTALVDLTQPGPFGPRTLETGRYIGVVEDGRLLALAGERMNLAGHVELSAICTHPQARGRRLAEFLMRHLMRAAAARGEVPFLHVLPDNEPAIALYRRLGFAVRSEMHYLWYLPALGSVDI